MRALLVSLLLVAASASAQPSAASSPPAASLPATTEAGGPTTGQRVLLVGAALGSGALSAVTLPPAAPLVIVGATYATGRALGLDAPLGRVAVDGLIGGAAGYAVAGGLVLYWTEVEGSASDLGLYLTAAAAGLTTMAVTTALLYDGRRVDIVPVRLAAPTGEAATGLSFRLSL